LGGIEGRVLHQSSDPEDPMGEPKIERVVPVFGISSYDEAVAHYVEWLGFKLDWEWREAPGQPVIMSVSRDDVAFMLNAHSDQPKCADVRVQVGNVEELADELNKRRPESVSVQIGLPYEFAELTVRDDSGNTLTFHCDNSEEQERLRSQNVPKMREYIQKRIDDGLALPTPEEVRKAVGPVLGFAIEVLNEFPEYENSYSARQVKPE
jgi:hypothetical protein